MEDEWKDERGAFERTGVGRGTDIEGKGYLQQLHRQMRQDRADPTEYIEALLAEIRNEYYDVGNNRFPLLTLSEPQIDFLKTKLDLIPSLKYKNPIGLIFGFYIRDGNGKISISKLKQVETAMKQPQFEYFKYVKPYDLIRYARLWDDIL